MGKFLLSLMFCLSSTIGLAQAPALEALQMVQSVGPAGKVLDRQGKLHATGFVKRASQDLHGQLFWSPSIRVGAPASYDLRALGFCSPVEDQGQCGSCWAFSVTSVLESALMRAGKPYVNLSAQEETSCAPFYGCGGGEMTAMDYLVTHGVSSEKDYPYRSGSSGTTYACKKPLPAVAGKGIRWGFCGKPGKEPTTEEIKQCMLDYGVLSVTVAAGGVDWSNGGHMTRCNVRGVNHMVRLAGWLETGELIGRNQWGTSWGDKGDFYAKQGCDQLASGPESVSFVVVDGAGPAPVIPHVTLPASVTVHPGTEVALGRRVAEAGVTYAWYADEVLMAGETGSMVYVTPVKSTVYRVKASTAAGTAESSVQVNVLSSL